MKQKKKYLIVPNPPKRKPQNTIYPQSMNPKRRWQLENPLKHKAQRILQTGLQTGWFKKPEYCEKCGNKTKIQGHHENYKRPYEISWLCRKCHAKADKKRREREGYQNQFHPQLIKEIRLCLDMTQMEFAEFIGVTQCTVNKWERGYYLPTEYLNVKAINYIKDCIWD